MGMQQKLDVEGDARLRDIAVRFQPGRCVACNTAGTDGLMPVDFTWRKQVSVSDSVAFRVERVSTLPLCPACWQSLAARRKWWRPMRLLGGWTMAASGCGILSCGAILYFMHLNHADRTECISVLIASIVLAPFAVLFYWFDRSLSVPASMMDLTGRGWECWRVQTTKTF